MKRILLVALVICAGMAAQAQKVNFGIKAGVNLSSLGDFDYRMTGGEDADLANGVGPYGGVFTQIYLTKHFGLETGLYYTQLGGRERARDVFEDYKVTARGSYLQLPLSAFYEFPVTKKISLYPSLGVYGAYGLAGKIKTEGQYNAVDLKSENDYFGDFANRFDFGGTAGLQVGFGKLLIGGSFDHGITRVNKTKTNREDNAYNSAVRLTVGFKF